MRPRTTLAVGITLALAGLAASAAQAQDGYRHGRLRRAEPGVSVQRASDVAAEEAIVNEPFLPGDRVWTDASGRAEFQFPDGSVVRLDRRSKLDYAGHEEQGDERISLRLWAGGLILRAGPRADVRFEVETPAGRVAARERSLVRVDVDAGEARVSVYEGEARFENGEDAVRLEAGERSYARWGERALEPQGFDLEEQDDFARWDADQEAEERWASGSAEYLPDELDVYSGEFDEYGDWRYENSVGRIWVPRVAIGWQPYSHGRWCWTPYGWTWVPYERWGWAPFHYGRWGHSSAFGWYWIPGRTWGPAWVSWAVGGGYVGWCPLGRHDRPVTDWRHRYVRDGGRYERGHAKPRFPAGPSGAGTLQAWHVVKQGELGRRDLAQRRLPIERVEASAFKVAESMRLRPTRDLKALKQADAVPRAISTRPTPGDFVRELAVDNKTTIPTPWFRRGGNDSRSEAVTRYRRGDYVGAGAAERKAAPPSVGAKLQPRERSDEAARAPQAGARERQQREQPRYAPRDERPSRVTSQPRYRARDDGGSSGAASQPSYRPRNDGASHEAPPPRYRPRDDGGGYGRSRGEARAPAARGGGSAGGAKGGGSAAGARGGGSKGGSHGAKARKGD